MNKSALAMLLAAVLFSVGLVNAQPAGSADKGVQKQQQQAPNIAEFDKQMAVAQENMKKMQEQMTKLQQTQDPAERQKLLQEHWTTMQNGMGMMQGMWGPGMMGCWGDGNANMMGGHMMGGSMMGHGMMGWQDAGGYYSKLTPEQVKQRQYMMDRYMNMQQMMMDHMMQHQNYMWGQPPK